MPSAVPDAPGNPGRPRGIPHRSGHRGGGPTPLEEALRMPARLVWVETPSNPMLRITDIAWVADRAHAAGAWCFCDNTAATPILQRPLALGADGVVHSATKHLGGHRDVMGGVVVLREEDAFARRLREIQIPGGAVLAPFEGWLILRGLRTLPYRMRAHSENAVRVAGFLARHPAVKAVHYPGLPDHPGHAIAARQWRPSEGCFLFRCGEAVRRPCGWPVGCGCSPGRSASGGPKA
nr:PLP-dependent transferase [Thermoflexus hugenholtzii]